MCFDVLVMTSHLALQKSPNTTDWTEVQGHYESMMATDSLQTSKAAMAFSMLTAQIPNAAHLLIVMLFMGPIINDKVFN